MYYQPFMPLEMLVCEWMNAQGVRDLGFLLISVHRLHRWLVAE
jgi:hypothetical protein